MTSASAGYPLALLKVDITFCLAAGVRVEGMGVGKRGSDAYWAALFSNGSEFCRAFVCWETPAHARQSSQSHPPQSNHNNNPSSTLCGLDHGPAKGGDRGGDLEAGQGAHGGAREAVHRVCGDLECQLTAIEHCLEEGVGGRGHVGTSPAASGKENGKFCCHLNGAAVVELSTRSSLARHKKCQLHQSSHERPPRPSTSPLGQQQAHYPVDLNPFTTQ